MLTKSELIALAKHHDGGKVLSVYLSIPADSATPATAARALLRHGLAGIRERLLFAPHGEREVFEACASRVSDRAEWTIHRQGAGTWIAFAAADGAIHDETISATLPTCVVWEDRVRIVPYLSVADAGAALVVMFDRHHATISRFALGALTELEHFETLPTAIPGPHMSAPPRQSFHPGTHGEPATEAAARQAESTFRRHTAHLLKRLAAFDHSREWIVLGGAAESIAYLTAWLTPDATGRLVVVPSLGVSSTAAHVRATVEAAIGDRHAQLQRRLVADLANRRPRPAVSAVGRVAVDAAITQRAVSTLLLAERWVERNAIDAETVARDAFAQDAIVEIARGDAGSALEQLADGIAARLRYAVPLQPIQGSSVLRGAASGMEN
jgi:hypothetical protein